MPYDHPVPFDTIFQPCWMPDLLFRTAERVPDAPLMDFMGQVTSYAETAALVRRAAAGMRALGIGPGCTVGLYLPNCPHYVIAAYATWLTGARLANFSPLYTAEELRHQVEDSEADFMVTLDATALLPTIEKVLANSRLKGLLIGSVAEVLPPVKSILYRLFKGKERTPFTPDARHIPFASLYTHGELPRPAEAPPTSEVALLQYTGGTTGAPKGAMLTHANLSINAQQVNSIDDDPDAPDRILAALPLFHIFAHTCIMNRTILRGGLMVMLPKFEVKAALAAIERTKITALPGVPTMYRALLDSPDIARHDLTSIRMCISGGAPLPEPLKEAFIARSHAELVEGYGLTESSGVVSANPYSTGGKKGSIGQPVPGTEIRLLDKDDPTRLAAPGTSGELAFRGPQMMLGYWKRDNTGVFQDGFLRTGDVAERDEDGYLFIVDRLKDMIIVGGFKVFPSQLEDILYTNPAVKEAIVIGIPDPYLGERPKAFVTLNEGATETGETLCKWLNGHVGKHERAVAVEVRDTLPKTMIGKLSRKELEEEERAKAA
ncbi:long-chain-fatty-acid--CoA ligase [Sandaracinobacteroides hominis]|uniref:long-chain-fatty-acid--CoA ligase n=1 Tax=Sandaracinobacteroides hominis TaxID=2780086 RepID=UPI0018F30FAA|nr:long-chain fatty acid--CoA ligase [Sandaracinobacteroides hominis]